MVATLPVSTLIEAARRVGVELHESNSGSNLYVWHTPHPERAVVYIGKSASATRTNNEQRWRDGLDPQSKIVSGIVPLLRVNRAELQQFFYDPETFDANRWRCIRHNDEWHGPAFDHLDAALPVGGALTMEQVENLLVRIAIRYGVPIGNSEFASQWENPIGTVPDTLAVLAVSTDPSFVIPVPNTAAERTLKSDLSD